jgi:indole-3-glycerol phosphate synthase
MILEEIVASTRSRLDELPVISAPGKTGHYKRKSLEKAIHSTQDRNAIIAEIKFASPSAGTIRENEDPGRLAAQMAQGGAVAISVLTEPVWFHGSPDNIPRVKAVTELPVLRKDFIIDERQIAESRALGADAILLIAALLGERLPEFVVQCRRFSVEPLVEVHSRDEVSIALESGASLIGINNRDLRTMKTNLTTTRLIAEELRREGITIVTESGISWPYDVKCLKKYCDAYLIGSSIMASKDPKKALEGFVYA